MAYLHCAERVFGRGSPQPPPAQPQPPLQLYESVMAERSRWSFVADISFQQPITWPRVPMSRAILSFRQGSAPGEYIYYITVLDPGRPAQQSFPLYGPNGWHLAVARVSQGAGPPESFNRDQWGPGAVAVPGSNTGWPGSYQIIAAAQPAPRPSSTATTGPPPYQVRPQTSREFLAQQAIAAPGTGLPPYRRRRTPRSSPRASNDTLRSGGS